MLSFLFFISSVENNRNKHAPGRAMILFFLIVLISTLSIYSCNKSSEKASKIEISRYRIEFKKEKMDCLFNSLFKYLATVQDHDSFYVQKGGTKYLNEIERSHILYSVIYNKKEFYIDFILLSNKLNSGTFYLKIAGEREFVDPFVKEISDRCKIEGIERIEGSDRVLIKWGTK